MGVPKRMRVWMAEQDYKFVDIAKKYKRTPRFISSFLKGKRTSNKLVEFLIKEGCPEECFKNGRVA